MSRYQNYLAADARTASMALSILDKAIWICKVKKTAKGW
jgi:hypothetical protein